MSDTYGFNALFFGILTIVNFIMNVVIITILCKMKNDEYKELIKKLEYFL